MLKPLGRIWLSITFILVFTVAMVLTFGSTASSQPPRACLYDNSCPDQVGNSPDDAAPAPDPGSEYAQALALAETELDQKLAAPGWQIWPNHAAPQVVNLWTFMSVNNDNWTTHQGNGSFGSVSVTLEAQPVGSHWTLTEAATGNVHRIECDGQGSIWSAGETLPDCGWLWDHSSDLIGEVTIEVEIEFEVVTSSSWAEAPNTTPQERRSRPSQTRNLTVAEVQTFGFDVDQGVVPGDPVNAGPGGGADNSDGSVPGETVETGATGLPVRTLTCSVWLEGSGNALGQGLSVGAGLEVIIEEFADGTQLVTVAGDAGGSYGAGTSAGFYVGGGDLVLGSYFKAEAAAWATVGGGYQFELAPGESWQQLLAEITVLSNPVASTGSTVLNAVIPFGDPIPVPPGPDAVFVDSTGWLQAGTTLQSGVGILALSASAGGSVEIHNTYKTFDEGYSATSTFSGELSADASIGAGVPFFAWLEAGAAAEAQGSISVETIFDKDFNPISAVITTSYGFDGDLIAGDGLVEGQEDDPLSVTTQQWTIDLTDPEANEAFNQFSENAGPDAVPNEGQSVSFGPLDAHISTTGPVTQTVTDNVFDFGVGAGVLAGGVELEGSAGCLELS